MGVKTPRVESDWIRTEARSLAVHPSWLSRTLPITVQLEPDPPDDLLEAQVHVHYANAAHGIDDTLLVQLAPDKRSQQLCIRLADANEAYDVTTMLFYQDGTHETLPTRNYPDPTAGQADQVVVINAPRANRINGDVLMRDPLGELETVLVDMKMQQGNNLLESRAFELNQSKGREVWSVRLTAPTPTPVLTYRERRLYLDGGLEEFEWRQSPSPNIVVGMPAEGVLAVSIQYLGPQLASVGLDAILLDLSYSDPGGDLRFTQNKAVLITDDGNTHRQEWKIRLVDKLATTYRWKMTLLFSDGSENSTEVNSDQRALLVIRLPSL
jgi:hypothetical protein